jgi:hypothetical protein
MSLFAQGCRIAAATALLSLCVAPWSVVDASPPPPTFIEESITEFTNAARTEPHTESVQRLDPKKYRAFRFFISERVIVGAAAGISLSRDGKVDIVQAPGTVLTVRANATHQVMSHVALLRDGAIDQSLLGRP